MNKKKGSAVTGDDDGDGVPNQQVTSRFWRIQSSLSPSEAKKMEEKRNTVSISRKNADSLQSYPPCLSSCQYMLNCFYWPHKAPIIVAICLFFRNFLPSCVVLPKCYSILSVQWAVFLGFFVALWTASSWQQWDLSLHEIGRQLLALGKDIRLIPCVFPLPSMFHRQCFFGTISCMAIHLFCTICC